MKNSGYVDSPPLPKKTPLLKLTNPHIANKTIQPPPSLNNPPHELPPRLHVTPRHPPPPSPSFLRPQLPPHLMLKRGAGVVDGEAGAVGERGRFLRRRRVMAV